MRTTRIYTPFDMRVDPILFLESVCLYLTAHYGMTEAELIVSRAKHRVWESRYMADLARMGSCILMQRHLARKS